MRVQGAPMNGISHEGQHEGQLELMLTAVRQLVTRTAAAEADVMARAMVSIDASELRALRFVGERGAVRMRDLAEELSIAPSSATDLADRLAAKDLVKRTQNPADRRIVLLSLSRQGRKIISDASDVQMRLCREMLESFAPDERETLVAMMQRVALSPAGIGAPQPLASTRAARASKT